MLLGAVPMAAQSCFARQGGRRDGEKHLKLKEDVKKGRMKFCPVNLASSQNTPASACGLLLGALGSVTTESAQELFLLQQSSTCLETSRCQGQDRSLQVDKGLGCPFFLSIPIYVLDNCQLYGK